VEWEVRFTGESSVDFYGDGVEPPRFRNSISKEFRKIEEGEVIASAKVLSDVSSGFDPRSSHIQRPACLPWEPSSSGSCPLVEVAGRAEERPVSSHATWFRRNVHRSYRRC
jgi:hypothetical protein